jgi:hypothetical protein
MRVPVSGLLPWPRGVRNADFQVDFQVCRIRLRPAKAEQARPGAAATDQCGTTARQVADLPLGCGLVDAPRDTLLFGAQAAGRLRSLRYAREPWPRGVRNADFQVCRIADFPVGCGLVGRPRAPWLSPTHHMITGSGILDSQLARHDDSGQWKIDRSLVDHKD